MENNINMKMYFTRLENYSFKKGGFSFRFKKEVFYSRKHSIQLLCIWNWPSKIQENAIKLHCLLPVSERGNGVFLIILIPLAALVDPREQKSKTIIVIM